MRHIVLFALIVWQVICHTFGQDFRTFLEVHAKPIENYIMEGYGDGWTNCDLMSITPIPNQYFSMLRRHFVMDMERIKTLDMSSLLSFSSCLLIAAKADDHETISKITQFGRSTVQHKRVAMLLTLGTNITLDAVNSTKLPYLVGAQLSSGKTQFLCPTPGSYEPIRSSAMCKQDYISYKGREIKVGFHNFSYPYGYVRKDKPYGIDGQFMELIQNKKNFIANFNY